jgi:beta-glucosidase
LRREDPEVLFDDGADLDRAARVAAAADVVVVVVGYTRLDEGEFIGSVDASLYALFPGQDEPDAVTSFEQRLADLPETTKPERLADRPPGLGGGGDRTSLRLKDHDVALIRAVAAANPRCVVAIQAGSAVLIDEWVQQVPAVVQTWYAGCEAGPGLADVLTGRRDPSGRLPYSVPASEEDLPFFDSHATAIRYDRWHGWWHLARQGTPPAYPFGFGLSYTTFAVSETSVQLAEDAVVVRAVVSNTGGREGSDLVQVYAQLPDAEAPPRLVGFRRVLVPAGGSADVTLTIPLSLLQTRETSSRSWLPAVGRHVFVVARHAEDPQRSAHGLDIESPLTSGTNPTLHERHA